MRTCAPHSQPRPQLLYRQPLRPRRIGACRQKSRHLPLGQVIFDRLADEFVVFLQDVIVAFARLRLPVLYVFFHPLFAKANDVVVYKLPVSAGPFSMIGVGPSTRAHRVLNKTEIPLNQHGSGASRAEQFLDANAGTFANAGVSPNALASGRSDAPFGAQAHEHTRKAHLCRE